MARDKVREAAEVKQRQGIHRLPSMDDLESLHTRWQDLGAASGLHDLLPARIVTLIEVAVRSWVETLIDFGAPYVERAAKIKVDLKYDIAVVRSLQGGAVTLGMLSSTKTRQREGGGSIMVGGHKLARN